MSSALKNRVVGTIIVVALAVILLPQFLDGEKNVNNKTFVNVPEAPEDLSLKKASEFDTEAVAQAVNRPLQILDEQPLDGVVSSASDSELVEPSTDGAQAAAQNDVNESEPERSDADIQTNTEQSVVPEIDVKESGWVIQLGSFSDEANARKLMRSVKGAGYRTYSRPIQTRMGVLTKVFVGPELVKSELENALPHLKEITGLSGKITEFEVSAQ
ncbi:SPOR domain-containing protein [Agaribacter marinus]|uniref:Cell division protein DedD n=1 Tax=Agaribacter marinus TaxID=1431249 RepID=A0AA37SWH2_9ALTE|nr:SPOR domain-containing protein [Agaribacter marinus]GLR69450.1 cell division protein DedD [Agaribacter marinus]